MWRGGKGGGWARSLANCQTILIYEAQFLSTEDLEERNAAALTVSSPCLRRRLLTYGHYILIVAGKRKRLEGSKLQITKEEKLETTWDSKVQENGLKEEKSNQASHALQRKIKTNSSKMAESFFYIKIRKCFWDSGHESLTRNLRRGQGSYFLSTMLCLLLLIN